MQELQDSGSVCVHEMAPRVDTGRVFAKADVKLGKDRSLLDVLIEKKQIGGQMLADVINEIISRGDVSDVAVAKLRDEEAQYFGWPSFEDVVTFSNRRAA